MRTREIVSGLAEREAGWASLRRTRSGRERERDEKFARQGHANSRNALVYSVVGHLSDAQLVELREFLKSTPYAAKVSA